MSFFGFWSIGTASEPIAETDISGDGNTVPMNINKVDDYITLSGNSSTVPMNINVVDDYITLSGDSSTIPMNISA